jgi:DNA-binding transcriptional regulator LsrR (DeoR family)
MDTQFVADHFEISRRRVQQLAKEYRETGEIPILESPGRDPYAEYPADLEDRIRERLLLKIVKQQDLSQKREIKP